MTTQDFINLCHDAQHDAGSKMKFNEKVTLLMGRIEPADKVDLSDPVCAFLAALLAHSSGSIDEQLREDFSFYFSELRRVYDRAMEELPE